MIRLLYQLECNLILKMPSMVSLYAFDQIRMLLSLFVKKTKFS